MVNLDDIVSSCQTHVTILEPDENLPEWWAGAPSVARADDGTFYLAARMREGRSPRGQRGYEIRIMKSEDGRVFAPVHHIHRKDADVPVFERPCLLRHPQTGQFRLYGCSGLEHGWSILMFDDVDDPADFDPKTARVVLRANYPDDGFVHVTGYKDPFVFYAQNQWHMFVIGTDRVERLFHFVSQDGIDWQAAQDGPVMENTGWHNYFTRPACVLPLAVGYLLVYEGSYVHWRDPVYNIATGLAYSPDLETFYDLTPDAPLLKSCTSGEYHTWRYSHWMMVDDAIYIYAEVARPNNTNEVRLFIVE